MEPHIGIYYQLVEKAIAILGIDPVKTRKKEGHWGLVRSNNPIWIFLSYQSAAKGYYFHVTAPILEMPDETNGPFFERLLALNSQLCGVAFMEKNGVVYLSTIREAKGLSVREAFNIMKKVGTYSSYYIQNKEKALLN